MMFHGELSDHDLGHSKQAVATARAAAPSAFSPP